MKKKVQKMKNATPIKDKTFCKTVIKKPPRGQFGMNNITKGRIGQFMNGF